MISVGLGQLCVTRAASSLVVSSSLLPSPFPAASVSIRPPSPSSLTLLRSQSSPRSHQLPQNPDDDDAQLEDLRVPLHWLLPPNAFQVTDVRFEIKISQFTQKKKNSKSLVDAWHCSWKESEWLRVTLHKWLDDEYCPEETNVEISKVAAQSYYKSLLEKQTDLGEILLKMARELESISYQESFHGAFSSANAAINLIAQRIEDSCQST
ncbi:uncharacterized protein LOC114759215 isoform X1 [Neltuma alba]|uniref:uncharacterized protein LOC114759215 isoform X1 n=1 Tax=Neltuma alba TaxID=207710 RepID=UPI0010A426EE|nr:uncharacterized protein LOC114759215 isoform X1 [Prosopis alba]